MRTPGDGDLRRRLFVQPNVHADVGSERPVWERKGLYFSPLVFESRLLVRRYELLSVKLRQLYWQPASASFIFCCLAESMPRCANAAMVELKLS